MINCVIHRRDGAESSGNWRRACSETGLLPRVGYIFSDLREQPRYLLEQ